MYAKCYIILLCLFCYFNLYASEQHLHPPASSKVSSKVWTCSMHPQIKSNSPGKCPLCGMDLITSAEPHRTDNTKVSVTLSKKAMKLAEIRTSEVVHKETFMELKLTGKLDYDETTSANIAAHFSGRVEKLFANYTGMYVNKGTKLAEIFGSDLYVNQKEILIAHNELTDVEESNDLRDARLQAYNSVMNKMRVLGFTKGEIDKIIESGKVSDTLALYAPISGTIIKKNIIQGQYFQKGQELFLISNLKNLWLNLDAYELDLPFLKYGQKVTFNVNAFPGKTFNGKIVFIEPILSTNTRTANIRVVVNNRKNLLKPGMFVQAKVYSRIGEKGVIQDENLKGKWISPMHPQIIKNSPGDCDICGMDLIPIESSRFYEEKNKNNYMPLVIPVSSALITGERSVVYVENKPGHYEPRTVLIGPRVGNYYIIKEGLHEGEKIVTNGHFKIDSELQIKSSNSGMISQLAKNNLIEENNKKPDILPAGLKNMEKISSDKHEHHVMKTAKDNNENLNK